jgi:hypothetical protein
MANTNDFTQSWRGNQGFPEKPNPDRAPSLKTIPQKVKSFGAYGEQFKGYGEQGDGVEVNDEAPAGNKRLLNGGKFVQQQMHKGTDLSPATPAETSIRSVRVADLGEGFGRGPLEGNVEIAGENRSLGKWLPIGGKASR